MISGWFSKLIKMAKPDFSNFFSKIFLWFPNYIISTCAILKILGLFMYPFVVKNSMCTVLQKWGHANHRTPATPSTTKHTHAFYNGMCMYRSYRMVQRNFNFLFIFRKLTIDLISPLPISSYVFYYRYQQPGCCFFNVSLYWDQKYSRLRCLLRVKSLVICFYLGWSGSILQIGTNIKKVGSKSRLLTCSSNITLSLPSYTGSALKRELNFCNGYLSLLYFCHYICQTL